MEKLELCDGVREAVPIVLGYLPLGFAFGVLARKVGMSTLQSVMMSALCFTGAGQYVAIGMMQVGGAVLAIVLTNILVNLRYLLFATSTVPYLKGRMPAALASFLSYGLTDETYTVAMHRYRQRPATPSYMAGLNLTAHAGWIAGTLMGAVLGGLIPNADRLGLGFALPAMYTSLLVWMTRRRVDLLVAVTGAAICLVAGHLFPATLKNLSNIIVATIAAATLGVLVNERH